MAMEASALAQDDARSKLLIPEGGGLGTEVGHFPRGAPGTSTGSPIAYGANWGDIYAGVGYQTPIRYSNDSDGSVTLGMGFLNSSDFVGLDVAVTSLSTIRSGFGDRMGLSAKVHRLLGDNWGIAAGVTNIYLSKQPADSKTSYYGVVSKVFDLTDTPFKALTLSVGAGNEDFRMEKDIRNNNETIGVFGSAALRIWDQLALIVDRPRSASGISRRSSSTGRDRISTSVFRSSRSRISRSSSRLPSSTSPDRPAPSAPRRPPARASAWAPAWRSGSSLTHAIHDLEIS